MVNMKKPEGTGRKRRSGLMFYRDVLGCQHEICRRDVKSIPSDATGSKATTKGIDPTEC